MEVRDDAGRVGRGESAAALAHADARPVSAEAVAGAVGATLGAPTLALRALDLSGLDLGSGAALPDWAHWACACSSNGGSELPAHTVRLRRSWPELRSAAPLVTGSL